MKPLPIPRLIKRPLRQLMVRRLERAYQQERYQILFVLGHMRSGSTLLLHILNTNPAILGFGETHREYRTSRDIACLTFDVCRAFGKVWPPGPYVLDKVLYRDYIQNVELIEDKRVKLVFLVRSPEESIASIVRFRPRAAQDEPQAVDYYVKQLAVLEQYARAKNDRRGSFFLTYDQLMHDTKPLLADLTAFLDLETPLTERYETMWSTGERGERGLGDDSAEIKTGRIVKKRPRRKVRLAQESVRQSRAAYESCVSVLREHCTHTNGVVAKQKTSGAVES